MNNARISIQVKSVTLNEVLSNYDQNATFILMLYFNVLEYQIRAFNTLLLNYTLSKLHISAFIIASLNIVFGFRRGSIISGAMKAYVPKQK